MHAATSQYLNCPGPVDNFEWLVLDNLATRRRSSLALAALFFRRRQVHGLVSEMTSSSDPLAWADWRVA